LLFQVKILELEDKLQKERQNLGRLRQAHYQIAVELYGEEAVSGFVIGFTFIISRYSRNSWSVEKKIRNFRVQKFFREFIKKIFFLIE